MVDELVRKREFATRLTWEMLIFIPQMALLKGDSLDPALGKTLLSASLSVVKR